MFHGVRILASIPARELRFCNDLHSGMNGEARQDRNLHANFSVSGDTRQPQLPDAKRDNVRQGDVLSAAALDDLRVAVARYSLAFERVALGE